MAPQPAPLNGLLLFEGGEVGPATCEEEAFPKSGEGRTHGNLTSLPREPPAVPGFCKSCPPRLRSRGRRSRGGGSPDLSGLRPWDTLNWACSLLAWAGRGPGKRITQLVPGPGKFPELSLNTVLCRGTGGKE